jgi:hypothetical protein
MAKLNDITPIDCGNRGVFKRYPRYKPFLLQEDSFLLGKHEVRLTYREIFGGVFTTSKMHDKGRNKFLREVLGPVIDPWKREELLERMQASKDEEEEREIILPMVRDRFDEVKFSNISELTLRRHRWYSEETINVTYVGGSISFVGCTLTPWGILPTRELTQDIFRRIQKGVYTYRFSS